MNKEERGEGTRVPLCEGHNLVTLGSEHIQVHQSIGEYSHESHKYVNNKYANIECANNEYAHTGGSTDMNRILTNWTGVMADLFSETGDNYFILVSRPFVFMIHYFQ